MTLLSPPFAVQGGVYTALLDRMHLNSARMLRNFSYNHRARTGFFPDRFPAVSVSGGMNILVGPCAGIIGNDFAADAGEYSFSNPSNLTVTLAASSPTQNRYDIIGFQVKDNFYDSSGQNAIVPAVIQGAYSSGTPSDPTLPSSFCPISRAVVNAGATTPTLQDLRAKTVPSGAILPIGSDAERAALGTPYAGMVTYRTDKTCLEFYNGASWVEGWRTTYGRGFVNQARNSNPVSAGAETGVDSFNATLVAGRRYKLEWHTNYEQPVGGPPFPTFRLRYIAGSTAVISGSTIIREATFNIATASVPLVLADTFTAPASGTFTMFTTLASAGTVSMSLGGATRLLLLTDIGG